MLDTHTPATTGDTTGRLFPGDVHVLRLVISIVSAAAISAVIAMATEVDTLAAALP